MPIVSYNYAGPPTGALALELLAKLQDAELAVKSSVNDIKPTLTVVTNNPIIGSSTSAFFESWTSCAKEVSGLIPSLRLWNVDDRHFEQWIVSSADLLGRC